MTKVYVVTRALLIYEAKLILIRAQKTLGDPLSLIKSVNDKVQLSNLSISRLKYASKE